ncbi:Gfo/Idh/MocA family oxidoreductase [bacterium]|nr:Gfo/Idh/MocA family oxidoreductase [bacterium]
MIRLAFVGLGGMGRMQVQSFLKVKGHRIVAGSDPSPDARAKFLELVPGAETFENHRDLLEKTDPDAVVVAPPTGLHGSVTSDFLKAGKPVLLEKPMARTVAECRKLNRLAHEKNTLLMIAHVRRFDPYWNSWANEVRAGRIGNPVLWRHIVANLGPGRWFMDEKMGGGPLLDGAVHDYDFANSLFGDPETVLSSSIKLDPSVTAIDTGSTIVRYASGNQLLLSWSWAARGCMMHDIVGPKGFIQFGTAGLTPPATQNGNYQYCCLTNGIGKQKLLKSIKDPSMFVRQARHFVDCVNGKAECASPGTEAIKAVAVAEAVLKAGPAGQIARVKW